MSTKSPIAELFGRSPIRPLHDHLEVSASASEELQLFFKSVIKGDWEKAEAIFTNIRTIEKTALAAKRELTGYLVKRLWLPLPGNDLIELLAEQQKIAVVSRDIASLVLARKLTLPEKLHIPSVALITEAIANVHEALNAVEVVDELSELGFSESKFDEVAIQLDGFSEMKYKLEEHQMRIREQIFASESELSPVDVMLLHQVFEKVGEFSDHSQQVAHHLLRFITR